MKLQAWTGILGLALLWSCAGPNTPFLPPPTLEEGDREMLQGNYLKAAQVYERLLPMHSKGSKTHWTAEYRACLCRMKLGQSAQILPRLQNLAASAAASKMRVLVHDALAEAHRLIGQHTEALRALQAIRDFPRQEVEESFKYDDFLFKIACAHLRVRETDAAAAHFRALLQYYPDSLRALDAAVRMAVRGFAVRIGEPRPAAGPKPETPKAGGMECSFVQVDVKGRGPMLVAVVQNLPSYDEAVRVAERLIREGVRAEALP
jgi:tetratricopeptide (TPR) repeat protein